MTRELSTCVGGTGVKDVLFIERLEGNETQTFTVYGSTVQGFFTHWNGSKTVPCWKDGSCEGGCNEETQRKNYLLQCYSHKKSKQVFLYLTPAAEEQLREQVSEGVTYRGLTIRVTRTEKKKGRLHVQVEQHAQARRLVSPEIDAKKSIMRFLRVPMALQVARGTIEEVPLPEADLAPRRRKCLKALGG